MGEEKGGRPFFNKCNGGRGKEGDLFSTNGGWGKLLSNFWLASYLAVFIGFKKIVFKNLECHVTP